MWVVVWFVVWVVVWVVVVYKSAFRYQDQVCVPRVKVVRALVSQMAYVQILVIFLQQVMVLFLLSSSLLHLLLIIIPFPLPLSPQALYHCGLPPSGLSPGSPQTYLLLVGKASFLLGLYGLFFFFTVSTCLLPPSSCLLVRLSEHSESLMVSSTKASSS